MSLVRGSRGSTLSATVETLATDLRARLRSVPSSLGRRLPNGGHDALRQLALFLLAYWAYRVVRGFADGQAAVAFENARVLMDAERALGSFFEPGLQAWALGQDWLVTSANFLYVNCHFTVTPLFLIWLYVRRNHAFYFVRNMFMVSMALALVLYVAFPTAPPRFLPEWGFTDTVAAFLGEATEQSANLLYNPFAAVPSMHVAFALMIAVPASRLVQAHSLKVAWALYPVMVTSVVLVTANHFWLDAAAGALVAALSGLAASAALGRARPEVWAWRTRRAEAVA
ncbi:phosphatase PAP2 family protein [soil metagenome]